MNKFSYRWIKSITQHHTIKKCRNLDLYMFLVQPFIIQLTFIKLHIIVLY